MFNMPVINEQKRTSWSPSSEQTAAVGDSIKTTNSLSSYARDEIDRGTLDISAKDTGKDLDAKSSGSSSSSKSGSGSGLLGSVVGKATQTALDKSGVIAGLPGGSGIAGQVIGDVVTGRKSPEQIAIDAATTGAKTATAYGLNAVNMPSMAIGPAIGAVTSVAKESKSISPNYGYALIGALAPAAAATLAAPLGHFASYVAGMVGAVATQSSLNNGVLGDMVDGRTHEMSRDDLEGQGMSRSASAAAVNNDHDLNSGYAPNNRATDNSLDRKNTAGITSYGTSNTTTNPNTSNNIGPNVDTPSNNGHSGDGGSGADSTGAGGDAGVGGAQDSGDHY